MVPWAQPSLHPKRHVNRFRRFFTAHHRVCHYFTMNHYVFPQKLPLPIGRPGPPSNTCYIWPTLVIIPNAISIGSAVFVWAPNGTSTKDCQWGRKPPKLPLHVGILLPRQRRTKPRAQATCTKKIARDCMHGWFVRYPRGPTDTRTDSSSQYFTTAPTSEVNNWINKRSVHPILLNRIELKKRFTWANRNLFSKIGML